MIAKKIALPALLLLLHACTQDPKTSEPYKQLEEDQRRTTETVAQRDSAINELFGTFNRISENLRTIRAKQGALVAPAGGSDRGAGHPGYRQEQPQGGGCSRRCHRDGVGR